MDTPNLIAGFVVVCGLSVFGLVFFALSAFGLSSFAMLFAAVSFATKRELDLSVLGGGGCVLDTAKLQPTSTQLPMKMAAQEPLNGKPSAIRPP